MSINSKEKDLEEQFKTHYSFLTLTAFYIVDNEEAAKDIVQDFFVWYCQNHSNVHLNNTFKCYATKAIKNISYIYLKKKKRYKTMLSKLELHQYEMPIPLENTSLKNKKAYDLLQKLPESRRNIFISYVVHGMSYSEIAKTYNISINTVKTQMKRSYSFFRTQIANKSFLHLFF